MDITRIVTSTVTSNTATPSSNSTTGDASASSNSNHAIPNAILAIIISFIGATAAAVVGLATYFVLRRRRRAKRANAQRGAEGQASSVNGNVGGTSTCPVVVMMEGLNELGEAPPPYVSDGVKAPTVNEREVSDEAVISTESPAEPPPAYFAALAMAGARNDARQIDHLGGNLLWRSSQYA